jgi:2-amino-4-hydroxy-6-hydroxymethyldihydropteridine diphosphokinase
VIELFGAAPDRDSLRRRAEANRGSPKTTASPGCKTWKTDHGPRWHRPRLESRDSLATLRSALAALRAISSDGECLVAPIYQTRPLDCPPGSPDFLNTVVEIGFDGGARRLLETTRGIENRLGRTRGALRNAPRVIDLDLLYCGDERIDSEGLTLPHPRMLERRFVLQPLADIRPDLVLPRSLRGSGVGVACRGGIAAGAGGRPLVGAGLSPVPLNGAPL